MKERYLNADRRTKGRLLDEMEHITGLHRKYLITRMNSPGPYRRKRSRERCRTYGPDVEAAVALIGESMDWICAERLRPQLVPLAEHLARFDELGLTPEVRYKLGRISVSTLRRMLHRLRPEADELPRPRRGRPREKTVAAQVPMTVIPADQPQVGHFEVDLVYHGPGNLTGPWLYTLQCMDVLTGWSERFALPSRKFEAVWAGVQAFKARCPLPIREVHIDNGSEFLNSSFLSHFGLQFETSDLTRGRPGHKNDNRFVEQKNASLVRAYLGELYLDTHEQLTLLRGIYEQMWLYYNLFQPVLRQSERTAHIGADGIVRIRRKQDTARSPLDRLLEAETKLGRATVDRLLDLRATTNPLALRREIHAQLKRLYRLAEREERRRAAPVR